MKGKRLSFVFINFFESSLFRGLQAKKIKKFLSLSTRVSRCDPNASNSVWLHFDAQPSPSRVHESSINIGALISGFAKTMFGTYPFSFNRGSRARPRFRRP